MLDRAFFRTAHFRWAPSCEISLTSRNPENQFLPVTEGNTPTVSDPANEVKKGYSQVGKK